MPERGWKRTVRQQAPRTVSNPGWHGPWGPGLHNKHGASLHEEGSVYSRQALARKDPGSQAMANTDVLGHRLMPSAS